MLTSEEKVRLVQVLLTYHTLYKFWQSFTSGELGALFGDEDMEKVRTIVINKMRKLTDELYNKYGITLP